MIYPSQCVEQSDG